MEDQSSWSRRAINCNGLSYVPWAPLARWRTTCIISWQHSLDVPGQFATGLRPDRADRWHTLIGQAMIGRLPTDLVAVEPDLRELSTVSLISRRDLDHSTETSQRHQFQMLSTFVNSSACAGGGAVSRGIQVGLAGSQLASGKIVG
eukprot:6001899-Prymnesium_polylepis.2